MNFNDAKKIHFIGIGGIGVSAIARMCLGRGVRVSGSDQSGGKVIDALMSAGATVYIGHDAKHISPGVDVVVHTIAIPESNPELAHARQQGIMTYTYPEVLSIVSAHMKTIAIAGTHGKTTTTGMVATCCMHAKKDPTVVIGSLLKTENGFSNFVAGNGEYFIVEACEYKRSFLHIHPDIAVITNIDTDHLDYYKDLADIQQAFCEFVRQIKEGGVLVTDGTSETVQPVVSYARSIGVQVVDYRSSSVWNNPSLHALKVPGEHNKQNAAAAFEACKVVGIDEVTIMQGLSHFTGTWRRFEYRGKTASGMIIYDDYGHHPTEISATLAAARTFFGKDAYIIAVFQPHLYSRTKEHLNDFARAFHDVDEIVVMPIYAAREPADPTISHHVLVSEIQKQEYEKLHAVGAYDTVESVLEYVGERERILLQKDVQSIICITIGAGDVYHIADALVHTLQ